jgi:predicted transcriptional regulator
MLETMPENFVEKLSDFVSNKLMPSGAQLKGIVELTTEGPVIVTREKLTHYEAVGLVLYASEERTNTAAQITKLLESSGIKSMVPARLNEMTKRGQVFKPDPNKPNFKLTIQGEKWIEEEVISKLRGKMT